MQKDRARLLARLALLTALEVVLSRFLSLSSPYGKIGFAFIPLAMAGMLYGPWGGAAVGTVSDLLGATLFPSGPFFPGFTLTTALKGAVFGLALGKGHNEWWRIAVAVVFHALVLGLGLNTLWLSILWETSFWALLPTRLAQELVVIPLQIVVLRMVGAPRVRGALE